MAALRFWVISIALVIAGPILALSTQADNGDISKILDHGKLAQARISKVEWTSKHHVDGDYVLLIDFRTDDGKEISRKLKVDSETGRKARDDEAIMDIAVRYLPENPAVVYPADVQPHPRSTYWIAALVSLVGAGMMIWRLFNSRRQK